MFAAIKETWKIAGKCQYCGILCEHVCISCKAWYCSDKCLKYDWLNHRQLCNPRTIHVDKYEESNKCTPDVNGKNVQYQRIGIKGSFFTETDYAKIEDPIKKTGPILTDEYVKIEGVSDSSDSYNSALTNDSSADRTNHESNSEQGQNTINEKDTCINKDENNKHNNKYDVYQNQSSTSQNETLKIKEIHDVHKADVPKKVNTPHIPSDRYIKIFVLWKDESVYWICRSDDENTLYMITNELNDYCTSTRAKRISLDDDKCCALYDGVWYRAKILSKANDTAMVKFVDFGNNSSIKLSDALQVPDKFKKIKPLAIKVKFINKEVTPKIGQICNVKAVTMDADVCYLELEGYSLPSSTIKSASLSDNIILPSTTCIKGLLPPRNQVLPITSARISNHLINRIEPSISRVSLQIQTLVGENCTTGFILADDSRLRNILEFNSVNDISKELSLTKADPEFKPSLKDEVCARVGEIWYRGLVTLINPDKTNVALVDLGVIVVPDALAPLPQHVKAIVKTAVRCIFSSPQTTNLVGVQIVVQNLYKEAEKLIGKTNKFGSVAILPWEPTCEDAGLISENIKSGISYNYKLTAFHSPKEIYIQLKEQNHPSRFFEFMQKVIGDSVTAPSVNSKPWCGQLVSCWSSKLDMYARAQVIKQIDDRYEVKFIDFGSIETVDLSKIKPLSDQLKSVPCFAIKVRLKGIPGSSFNIEANKIMNQLMDKDSVTVAVVENNNIIRLFDGMEEINMLINDAMLPSWPSRNKTDSVIFMSNEIVHEKWLSGQNMRLCILQVNAFNEIVVVNSISKVFAHAESMVTEIGKFCSSDATPYTPRAQETCLAKFLDNKWYRAQCLSSNEDSAKVYYFDYGNNGEVNFRNIRKMSPKFLYYPTGTKTCIIYGLSDSLPVMIQNQIIREYQEDFVEATVVCDNNDGSAVLYIPEFMDLLLKHSLTSVTPPPAQFLAPTNNC